MRRVIQDAFRHSPDPKDWELGSNRLPVDKIISEGFRVVYWLRYV